MWNDADDDLDDREAPDDEDRDDEDDETDPCPWCGEPVYHDAERCPDCGKYLSREDSPRRLPAWLLIGVGLGLLVCLGWVFFGR